MTRFEVGQLVRLRALKIDYRIVGLDENGSYQIEAVRKIETVAERDIEPVICASCGCMVGTPFIYGALVFYPVTGELVCPNCYDAAEKVGTPYFHDKVWVGPKKKWPVGQK